MLISVAASPTQYALQIIAQGLAIACLVDVLRRAQATRTEIATWFILSLIPQVWLAVTQFDAQHIRANSWLGIAAQNPATPGVSVVGEQRVLRAYAGFPHPNIAGIWFAMGIAAVFWLARNSHTRQHLLLAWIMAGALPIALIVTFSRTAFVAAALICTMVFVWALYQKTDKYLLRMVALTIVCGLVASIPVLPQFMGRLKIETALEERSLNERKTAWASLWPVASDALFAGHGLGSAASVMQRNHQGSQPPHAVPLIVMLESGLLGVVAMILTFWLAWHYGDMTDWALFVIMLLPAITDHFLWSLWSGQLLIGYCVIWSMRKRAED